jgi:hypothetical protein
VSISQKHPQIKHFANKYTTNPNKTSDTFIPRSIPLYATRFITASASKSSWNKHASALACFRQFESSSNFIASFPLTEYTLCAFVNFMVKDKNLKHATVQSYLSSLDFFHKLRKLDNTSFHSFIVKTMLKGVKNLEFYTNLSRISRRALTFPLHKILSHEIAKAHWTEDKKQVLWTAMTVAFFGSFRFGELLSKSEKAYNRNETLLWENVRITDDAVTVTVKIPKSRKASIEFIDLLPLPDSRYCSILALKRLRKMHHTCTADTPVFAFKNGTMLTHSVLNETAT